MTRYRRWHNVDRIPRSDTGPQISHKQCQQWMQLIVEVVRVKTSPLVWCRQFDIVDPEMIYIGENLNLTYPDNDVLHNCPLHSPRLAVNSCGRNTRSNKP